LIPEILTEYTINAIYERASITCSAGFMDDDLTFDDPLPESEEPDFHIREQLSERTVASIFCDWLKGNAMIGART
jgi:hypothetical protein